MAQGSLSYVDVFRRIRLLMHGVLAVAILLLTGGCSRPEHKYHIAVAQPSSDEWRSKLNDEILREVLLHGNEADVEILDAGDDPNAQVDQIHSFINAGADIIIVSPVDAHSSVPAIRDAISHGIPVIVFDRDLDEKCYTAFVGADNRMIGYTAGNYIASRINPHGGGEVLEITGLESSTPAMQRHSGFADALSRHPHIHLGAIVDGQWTPEGARSVADTLLLNHPGAAALFAHNDRMAIAARCSADSLRAAGHKVPTMVIVGVDAVPTLGMKAVADSTLDATFMYPTGGAELVETAINILHGTPYDDTVLLQSDLPVEAANADILMLLSKTIDRETAKAQRLMEEVNTHITAAHAQRRLNHLTWALLALALVCILMLLRIASQRKTHRKKLADQNEQLRLSAEELKDLNHKLKEANREKIQFFTNVSHDLRTPLTLIADPIERVRTSRNLDPNERTLMSLADKNVRVLKRLINQILDFRRYDSDNFRPSLKELDICRVYTEWCDAFRTLALRRHLIYSAKCTLPEGFHAALDPMMVERIFFNLMSNAFRYTSQNGHVSTSLTLSDDAKSLVLRVSDSGEGIPEDKRERIFGLFYRGDVPVGTESSGIGLALVKQFVTLMEGSIEVESTQGKGTTFVVTIPVNHVAEEAQDAPASLRSDDVVAELDEVAPTPTAVTTAKEATDGQAEEGMEEADQACLLVIDDNPDIRALIKSVMSPEYIILEGENGVEGIKKATKYIPDAVICDVMMPVMDGLETTRRLKEELTTSHIPVLMLTARALEEQQVEGLHTGADAYLTKPFSANVLRAQIESLIANRRRIKNIDILSAQNVTTAEKREAQNSGDADDEFYKRFLALVDKDIADSNLSVVEIGQRLGLSRVQFYRKLKALTGYAPTELLRVLRLKRAYTYLTSSDATVAEISYRVGFSSPSYFSKCFKAYFGELPLELQRRTSKIE